MMKEFPRLPQVSCHITYTTARDKRNHSWPISIALRCIREKFKALARAIVPLLKTKLCDFADKERHQIFLEPEGLNTQEVYVNGVSSSLPFDVQHEVIHSIPALRNAEIMRPAYAIEYDYVISGKSTLR